MHFFAGVRRWSIVRRGTLAIVMMNGLGGASSAAAQDAEPHRDAPFQVVAFSATHLRVDVGADRARAVALREATVLTEAGALQATLVRTRRVCTRLCGDGEGPTCHYEAVLRAPSLKARPLGVLAGRRTITAVHGPRAAAERAVRDESRWLDATPLKQEGSTYRWRRFSDGVHLSSDEYGRDFYAPPIALTSCTERSLDAFTLLTCGADAELLYDGNRPVLLSLSEYASAKAQPILTFSLDGRTAVLVRLGVKGEEIAALLIADGDAWQLAARAADYALLC